MTVTHARTRTLVGALVATLLAGVLVAAPARASHQACGAGYPLGTLPSGHPDVAGGGVEGWTGLPVLQALEATGFALASSSGILDATGDMVDAIGDVAHDARDKILWGSNPASGLAAVPLTATIKAIETVADGLHIAAQSIFIAETAIAASGLAVGFAVAEEDACGGTIAGDMTDVLWIALVERNLASSGPPPAMLLLPVEGDPDGEPPQWPLQPLLEESDFSWCPEITLPEELPAAGTGGTTATGTGSGKADCTPPFHTGFLNAPEIGVEAIVRDTIDHARSHGLLPDDTDPDDGVPSREEVAEAAYDAAITAIDAGQYGRAFNHFRVAYQTVMGLT